MDFQVFTCKVTGNATLLVALSFCLKFAFMTYFQNVIIKLNFAMTDLHKMSCNIITENLPAFHILVLEITIASIKPT